MCFLLTRVLECSQGCTFGQETWKYCEEDARAQGALDVMLNSSPGSMVG